MKERINSSGFGHTMRHVGGNPEALDHTCYLESDDIVGKARRVSAPPPRTVRAPTIDEARAWAQAYGCRVPLTTRISVY